MPAHLPGKRRTAVAQLRLDERVTGAPHRRPAPKPAHPGRDMARALDVKYDLGARAVGEDVTGKQHDLPIRVDDLAGARDDTQAIAVAVEGQSQLGPGTLHGLDEVLQVLRMRRVRDDGSGNCRQPRNKAPSPCNPGPDTGVRQSIRLRRCRNRRPPAWAARGGRRPRYDPGRAGERRRNAACPASQP